MNDFGFYFLCGIIIIADGVPPAGIPVFSEVFQGNLVFWVTTLAK
jgi:hypothetical protein